MQKSTLVVGGIAVTVLSTKESSTGIFCLHGRQNSAQDFLEKQGQFFERLAQKYTLFLFDQRNHGQRLIDEVHNFGIKRNENHASDMYSIQYGSAMDISFLIDAIPLYKGINKWGVLGFSLGGHAALLSLTLDPRLSVGVSVVGCGDYESLMESRGVDIPPALKDLLIKRDPLYLSDRFIGKHLLCLYGGQDRMVPESANRQFTENLRKSLENQNGQFKSVVDPDCGHELSGMMMTETIDWFEAHFN